MASIERATDFETVYFGGITNEHQIEFYEYARASYALARLLAAAETFRRTGRVPARVTSASNPEIYTSIPQTGSWKLINHIVEGASAKIGVSFDAISAWLFNKALDNRDLFNSNTSAIAEQNDEIDPGAVVDFAEYSRRRRSRVEVKREENLAARELSDEALDHERQANRKLRDQRLSLESEAAVARRLLDLRGDGPAAFDLLRRVENRLSNIEKIIEDRAVRVYDEEKKLVSDLENFVGASVSDEAVARRAVRSDYALDDLEARFNRRALGENIDFASFGVSAAEQDRMAARVRGLNKEIVLPLRKSSDKLSYYASKERLKIAVIDKARGRAISASHLSKELYRLEVFVVEYNRVFHGGKCDVDEKTKNVPFSLKRQLVNRLNARAIDSLKESNCVMLARLYLDEGGQLRSLLVEDIEV